MFADLGLPDAGWLKIKSGLTIEMVQAIRKYGLTQAEALRRTGLPDCPKPISPLRTLRLLGETQTRLAKAISS